MKALVVCNEDLETMIVGTNSTLGYLAALISEGHEALFYKVSKEGRPFPESLDQSVRVVRLKANPDFCQALVWSYGEKNREIVNHLANDGAAPVRQTVAQMMEERGLTLPPPEEFSLSQTELLVQRFEPNNSPFLGEKGQGFNETIAHIRKLFPNLVFNAPPQVGDKGCLPFFDRAAEKLMGKKIATPTASFTFGEDEKEQFDLEIKVGGKTNSIVQAVNFALEQHQKLYPESKNREFFVKPADSAQAFGAFGVTIKEGGMNLRDLQEITISELARVKGYYEIRQGLSLTEMRQMLEIICFVQSVKVPSGGLSLDLSGERTSSSFDREVVVQQGRILYGETLVQPALEEVRKFGDVRMSVQRGKNGFEFIGATFRNNLSEAATTGFCSGNSQLLPIDQFPEEYRKRFEELSQTILHVLNSDPELIELYRTTLEIGFDIVLGPEGKVFVGEGNGSSPALGGIGGDTMKEVMRLRRENLGEEVEQSDYDGGFGPFRRAIRNTIWLQRQSLNVNWTGSGGGN